MSDYRAGVVAILGRPNAGKSTLMNAILGEKLAIVTAKPQTTRSRILGIHTRPDAQLLFVDTPGLHETERAFNASLNDQAREAGGDCDVALLLVDLTGRFGADHARLLAELEAQGKAVLVVGTKSDLAGDLSEDWPPPGVQRPFRVSARKRDGIDALVDAVAALLPESPPLYPDDDLSDRSLRFLVAELVREAAFESLEQELPYALAVEVEQFDESRPDLVRIRANLIVERKSQKPIVIGREGKRIKRIGTRARHEIEKLVGTRVHLELWVKIEPNWTKKPARVESLGYV